jgi:hypothetical protein
MPSVTISSYLTFTSKRLDQIPTITFTNGAIAGFEVVTVTGHSNISVKIQSGITTMLQVKTAVEAQISTVGFSASDLVSVSITTGHNSDVVQTVVNAALSGAITANTKAFAVIGPILYTAVASGSGGNAISVAYTDGVIPEVVSVVSNAISVAVADAESAFKTFIEGPAAQPNIQKFARPGIDYSTSGSVITKVKASVPASALVDVAYAVVGTPAPVYADAAETARFLTGGTDASPATLTVEGLTITSITNDATQNGAILTFTTGATAGSEVVTVVGNNVSVQIENGVSTVTQVRTALNLAAPFTAKYTASGTSSTPVYTVNGLTLA